MIRLGVDVGGTFTDLILKNENTQQVWVHKVPSTPHDPSQAILKGIPEICRLADIEPASIDSFFHGTTVATNIVLEHNGAEAGMITTEGFRDVLHIGRHKRPYNFSLYQDLPWQAFPLVKRRNRLTVAERVSGSGEILVDLNEDEVRERVRQLKREGVQAVAICLMFSFKNDKHEKKVKEIVEEEFPEAFLSVSSEVLPQYREYERFSTVALNAYVGPKTSNYIKHLKKEVVAQLGIQTEIHLMQSNGGIATSESAAEKPIGLLLSGPVAGLIGGITAAQNAGFENVITLDIGGTSADIGVAPNGEMRMRHLLDSRIGEYNSMVPMVEIEAIGAGGGSLAYVDSGGIFRVGPQSAGAYPGPASYNQGGERPTSTDANVLLGRIQPNGMLGGDMQLDKGLAEQAFHEHVATKLNITSLEAAAGALDIMTHNMVNAIELNSVRKGYDPRDFVLVAAGGAGPLFACDIAEELNIPFVVVPPYPGITAATGLLDTDIMYERVHTLWGSLSEPDIGALKDIFANLEKEALQDLETDGVPEEKQELQRICDCRYNGQGYELRVEAPAGQINEAWIEQVITNFHEAHEREYASQSPEQTVDIINVRVKAIGHIKQTGEVSLNNNIFKENELLEEKIENVYFKIDNELKSVKTPFYNREHIKAGTILNGPSIVQQKDSTTIIPPYADAKFDNAGNIIIRLNKNAEFPSKTVNQEEKAYE